MNNTVLFIVFIFSFCLVGNAQTHITLVEDGRSEYVIIVEDDASVIIEQSAEELNVWINKITGVKLPIISISKWDGKSPYIAIGCNELTKSNGWERIPFEQEEARVFIEKDRIGLLGNDTAPYSDVEWKGTYYAVNEFVRNALNVRWIWPGELGEVFERRSTLS